MNEERREEELELVRRAKEGDAGAKAELLKRSAGIVFNVARRYKMPGMDLEDLFQEGSLGVLHAIEKFDPARGRRFDYVVSQQVRKTLSHRVVKGLSTQGQIKAFFQLGRASRALFKQEREATDEAVAEYLDVFEVDVRAIRSRFHEHDQIVDQLGEDDSETRGNQIIADESESIEEKLSRESGETESANIVAKAVAALPKREREVIRRRYFGVSESLAAIGRSLKLSRETVRKIEVRALDALMFNVLKAKEALQ